MQRCYVQICHIHRHLCYAVFINVPPYSLSTFQCSGLSWTSLFSDVKGYCISSSCACAVEVEVHCNEEVASTDDATSCMHDTRSVRRHEVRLTLRVAEFLGDCLVLTASANGKVLPLWFEGCCLVTIARYLQLVSDALRQVASHLSTLFQRYACHRNEWQHIGSSYSRMGTLVLAHVYEFSCRLHSLEGSFYNRLRSAYECHHRSVGSCSRVNV